jgi:putative transposase
VIDSLTGQGFNVRHACRTLGVSESGYYAWKDRPDPPRTLRRIWLAGEIADVHKASGGTYGAHRVTAELKYGRGIQVGHNAVELIMRQLGIKGTPTRRLPKGARVAKITSLDLVRRVFARDRPNALWVTDITEHPTNEGKIYCCVVLDTFSRLVAGWSIDSTQTTALVLNALGMATQRRPDRDGLIVHSDRGTQFTSWAFSDRLRTAGIAPSMGAVGTAADNAMMRASGGACRSKCSTAGAGRPGSSSPPRSTTTSCSTTPGADTPRSECAPRPRSKLPGSPAATALSLELDRLGPPQRCWLTRGLRLVSPLCGPNQSITLMNINYSTTTKPPDLRTATPPKPGQCPVSVEPGPAHGARVARCWTVTRGRATSSREGESTKGAGREGLSCGRDWGDG